MIHATPDGSYEKQPGSKGSGSASSTPASTARIRTSPRTSITHSRATSRRTSRISTGRASTPSCVDPANEDDNGHGTHVAGTIGAAINGFGIAGVAPNVTLVNIRAGQDSGFFFLQPCVDALTYAADNGIDVVNMSYYIDPWLYNCADNPADTPEQQAEQRTIVKATNRALDYAHKHGVTLDRRRGQRAHEPRQPQDRRHQPGLPARDRLSPRTSTTRACRCRRRANVINVGAVGPTTMKSDYSNYGFEYTDVAAPGGCFRDGFGTPLYRTIGERDPVGVCRRIAGDRRRRSQPGRLARTRLRRPRLPGRECAYYQYLQGTSMASPHAVGVAALIVSQYGHPDGGKNSGQLTHQAEGRREDARVLGHRPCLP